MAVNWMEAIVSPSLAGRVELAGLVDIDIDAARKLQADFALNDVPVGVDLGAMLSRVSADAVFDVAVPAVRMETVKTAFAHGCHILTEKPMATSLAEAREMIAAAKAAGRVHAITQNRRYKEGIRRMRQLVESGVLGRITALHCDFFIGAHFGGFREAMEHVLLLDMAIHTFDAARFMSGEEPVAVYCHESNPAGSWYAHGAAANAIFEMTGDVVFTYRGSWCAEGANTNWDSAWRIIGTKGTAIWDGEDGFNVNIVDAGEGFFRPLRRVSVPASADPDRTWEHASIIAEFLDAIEGRGSVATAGSDNIKSLEMVFAAIKSASTKQRIAFEKQVEN